MTDLMARLGLPQRAFTSVHVAGTKGKGSVASLIATGFSRAGFRTGLYTSPHVEDVRERVRVLGNDADSDAAGDEQRLQRDEIFAAALEAALAARERALAEGTPGSQATWFDVLTAGAFTVFRASAVEWAVVECGLGGRLDSTNVLAAPFVVLTNIDLEHTAILGSTRKAIAREKAGIISPGSVVISGVGDEEDEAGALVHDIVRQRGALLVSVETEGLSIAESNSTLAGALLDEVGIETRGPDMPLGHDLLDARTRAAARLPGRLERRDLAGVSVVLDGAHVPSSLDRVLAELEADPTLEGRPEVVLAVGKDKPLEALLKVLEGRVDRVHCTLSGTGFSRSVDELAGAVRRAGFEAVKADSPGAALDLASSAARANGWVLVTGSLHLVGAVRATLIERPETLACSRSFPISS